ncbi:MAG: threonylcarbamoyl-AMP synthase [Alphaproteobacteria bacterium]|nr:threonylcarbamoyl-AMP synthase [Alphaproteobacteria bacterium]
MSPTLLQPVSPHSLDQAAALLKAGHLVAFPTETVYGLGADATNDAAVAKIYAAKGRPQFNPLIAHAAHADALRDHVVFSPLAEELAAHFWPGPLTLVLPQHHSTTISRLASAGLPTLAVRVPSHPAARQLLKIFGGPVVAPSANISGQLSATTPQAVHKQLGHHVGLILADGKTTVGVESTIVDVTGDVPMLRRPGGITLEQLEPITGKLQHVTSSAPNSPGQLASHYAPRLPLRLNVSRAEATEAFLLFGPEVGLVGGAERLNLSPRGDLVEAAANLFSYLDQLDHPQFSGIAVARIPTLGLGLAINDRLQRAAAPRH